MIEGIIGGLIAVAVSYVSFMRVMSRRADVLHGTFIQQGTDRQAN